MNHSTHSTSISFALEKRVCFGLGVLSIGIMLLYTYFVALSIGYVVDREELVQKTSLIAEQVSSLEKEYLALSGTLTETYARASGFTPVVSKSFLEKKTLTLRGVE